MIATVNEMKTYLRVDFDDDDDLIASLINTAEELVADVIRIPRSMLEDLPVHQIRIAVYYAVAYLYEHREEADHHALTLTLRSLLFGIRKEGF